MFLFSIKNYSRDPVPDPIPDPIMQLRPADFLYANISRGRALDYLDERFQGGDGAAWRTIGTEMPIFREEIEFGLISFMRGSMI